MRTILIIIERIRNGIGETQMSTRVYICIYIINYNSKFFAKYNNYIQLIRSGLLGLVGSLGWTVIDKFILFHSNL